MNDYLAEIRLFAGNFAPVGWRFCDGALLNINEYEALFAVVGTLYGGNGTSNFALPNMSGRVAIGVGNNFTQGQQVGSETVALTVAHLPPHNHSITVKVKVSSTTGTTKLPVGKYWAPSNVAADTEFAAAPSAGAYMAANVLEVETGQSVGAPVQTPQATGQPTDNMQPFLGLNYIICVQGLFPAQG